MSKLIRGVFVVRFKFPRYSERDGAWEAEISGSFPRIPQRRDVVRFVDEPEDGDPVDLRVTSVWYNVVTGERFTAFCRPYANRKDERPTQFWGMASLLEQAELAGLHVDNCNLPKNWRDLKWPNCGGSTNE
jgi:hypothetical protein